MRRIQHENIIMKCNTISNIMECKNISNEKNLIKLIAIPPSGLKFQYWGTYRSVLRNNFDLWSVLFPVIGLVSFMTHTHILPVTATLPKGTAEKGEKRSMRVPPSASVPSRRLPLLGKNHTLMKGIGKLGSDPRPNHFEILSAAKTCYFDGGWLARCMMYVL